MLDRRIDKLILAAAGEPFLEHTLRPLHTIFRRIGWIHHNHIGGQANVQTTIDCHLAVLDAVANRHVDQAMAASDALIDFVDSMFDIMEREIDPSLLDCSLEPLIVRRAGIDKVDRFRWSIRGENAGLPPALRGFWLLRIAIRADVVIQAEEVAEEDDFELGLDLPVPDSTTWRNRSGAARAAAALSPRKGMG